MTQIGYLVPTREAVMEDRPAVKPLLALAERAEDLGYDSIWVGDSLLARPRHEPLTLLAGIATRTERVTLGTAVLLPAYRNPVIMAQQVATLDQLSEGRLVLGVGIAADRPNIRAEFAAAGVAFERRVGRMQEGLRLCRALWSGAPVDWDGRWQLTQAQLGPAPYRPGGPPIWGAGSHPQALTRAGRTMDGWLPLWPDEPEAWAEQHSEVLAHAMAVGKEPGDMTAGMYLTLFIHEQTAVANARVGEFLEAYYEVPGAVMRRAQACFGGTAEAAAQWIDGFVRAGVQHVVLRFAGDHERHLTTVAQLRSSYGW